MLIDVVCKHRNSVIMHVNCT